MGGRGRLLAALVAEPGPASAQLRPTPRGPALASADLGPADLRTGVAGRLVRGGRQRADPSPSARAGRRSSAAPSATRTVGSSAAAATA